MAPNPTIAQSPVGPAPTDARTFRLAAAVLAILVTTAGLVAAAVDRCPWTALCGPLLADDVGQPRADVALPLLQGDLLVEQTLIPAHDGLTAVDVLLARYEQIDPGPDDSLTLELWDVAGGRLVAALTLATAGTNNGQTAELRFAAEPDSAGRTYALQIHGTPGNSLSPFGYSLAPHDGTELRLLPTSGGEAAPETTAHSVRYATQYALTWRGAFEALAGRALSDGLLIILAALVIPLPGCLLLLTGRRRGWDPATWWGAAVALGLSLWPLLWYGLTLLGGRWSPAPLWLVVTGGWAAVLLLWWRRRRQRTVNPRMQGRSWWPNLLLLALLALTLATRYLAVRDLGFLPWVDSSRHALITAVMLDSGQTPSSYEPYLPVDHFPYHFGVHTILAGLGLMSGWPLAQLLLVVGQLLGALIPLTVYAAAWLVSRRRGVALLAAFLVAIPFFFPGYYATWGRLTQLAAMAVMPVLIALTWRLSRGWQREWYLVGVLAAGVFYLHFRVFLFYVPYAFLVLVYDVVSLRRWRPLVQAGALAVLLVAMRLVALWRDADPLQTIGQSLPGYNDFPSAYYETGWERYFIWLAIVCLIPVLIGALHGRRWSQYPLLLVSWVAALFLLLSGDTLGLPETLLVNLNSMYITLFLPLALYLALVAGQAWRAGLKLLAGPRVRPYSRGTAAVAGTVAGLACGALLLFGVRQQTNIINRETVLALGPDAAALAWVAGNVPAESLVAVSSWQWLGRTWAASDGGAWLLPLAARQATTPPIDHIYNPELFARVLAFNEAAVEVEDWSAPSAAAWLREHNVTHVYAGARGGYLDPAQLARNPEMRLIYGRDQTYVFALNQP